MVTCYQLDREMESKEGDGDESITPVYQGSTSLVDGAWRMIYDAKVQ